MPQSQAVMRLAPPSGRHHWPGRSFLATLACALLLLWLPRAAAVELRDTTDELRLGVEQLLQQASQRAPGAIEACAPQYEALQAQSPADSRIEYAWAVVLLHQRKYAAALTPLAACIRADPADLDAAAWYLWALVHCRRHDDALAAARHVGRRIADEQLASPAARHEAARFLGALLGYLELIPPPGLNRQLLSDCKNDLLAALSAELRDELDAGRAEVANRLAQFNDDRQARIDARESEIARMQESATSSLEDHRRAAADSQAELSERTAALDRAAQKLAILERQMASINQDRALLATQIIATQAQINQLNLDTHIHIDIPGIQNPTGRGMLVENSRTHRGMDLANTARIRQFMILLTMQQRQMFDLDRRLHGLTQQARQLHDYGSTQSDFAAQNVADARRATRRAENLEKQLLNIERAKPTTAPLTASMRSLATYLPFPFEAEKARALARFAAE